MIVSAGGLELSYLAVYISLSVRLRQRLWPINTVQTSNMQYAFGVQVQGEVLYFKFNEQCSNARVGLRWGGRPPPRKLRRLPFPLENWGKFCPSPFEKWVAKAERAGNLEPFNLDFKNRLKILQSTLINRGLIEHTCQKKWFSEIPPSTVTYRLIFESGVHGLYK